MSTPAKAVQSKDKATTGRKRGFWRSIAAGLIAKFSVSIGLAIIMATIRPFVWTALYDDPYIPARGPIVPGTNEWFLVQLLGLTSAIIGGVATARWSKAGSWRALGALAAFMLLMSAVKLPDTMSPALLAIWLLEMPFGVVLGGWFYFRYERR